METFYLHAILATFLSYLLVSIFYRDLLWTATLIGLSRYRGKRAFLLSIAILLLVSLIVLPILRDRYEWFSFQMLGYGFLAGLPIAWALHRLLSYLADRSPAKNPLLINVPENLKPQAVTSRRFTFWSVAGVLIGAFFGFILFIVSSSILLSVVLGLVSAVLISWLLARANWF